MKKILFILLVLFFSTALASAQTRLVGLVSVANSNDPLPTVTVTVMQQNFSTRTNALGEFVLTFLEPGEVDVQFSRTGYLPTIVPVVLVEDQEVDMGTVYLQVDLQEEARQEALLQLSESNFSEDEGRMSQSVSSGLARGDVYLSQTSFNFSPMRFRLRGYEQEFESTYINGVHFNALDRGGFNYSSLGGLNDANRNKDIVVGPEANSFSYGNIGTNTNILNRASNFAAGTKASASYSNRAYKLRGQATYATGLMPNGWAFAVSGVARWADEGIVDGTFYNSAGLFFSVDKMLNQKHSLSLIAYGAPTKRAQQSGTTQEAYDLAGSIYYNTYWGWQDGVKRNSRIVKSFDPTAILLHDFNISDNQRLRTGIAYHYSMYSNSALGFYNAPDPRPDYYRNMPSFQPTPQNDFEEAQLAEITESWKQNPQIDWQALYDANTRNNIERPNASAKYVVERRHMNLMETVLNSNYSNRFNQKLKLTAGIEAKLAKDMNYKTMDDLMGGNQWIDIDQFAERDLTGILAGKPEDIIQNDLNNRDRKIYNGDIFGYNYDINIFHGSAYLQNEWNFNQVDLYYAGKLTYTQFNRYGHMRNGRAPENSYGASKALWFIDPSIKAGGTYKIDGRNRITVNAVAETRAPLPSGAYVSERIKDTHVPNLKSRQILSYDISYNFLFPAVRGKVAAFQTHILQGSESTGYYDDEERTFINYLLSGVNKVYRGIEAGVSVKLNSSFSISAAGTYADYRYTSNSLGTMSFENGAQEDKVDSVYTKNLKTNTGPQMAFNVTLDYFHPKMWFADITLNYFDNNYLDFAPSRFSKTNVAKYTTDEMKQSLGTQEKLNGGFLLDASVGKLIYLKDRRSLNLNLSLSNMLNNTNMITGGYQQGRLPIDSDTKAIDPSRLNYFPNKYYYAWGFNLFLNVGYKF